jgi:hypothetical protein
MVGWSSRNRGNRIMREEYYKWLYSLSPEEQAEVLRKEEEENKRNRPYVVVSCILGLLVFLFFVSWPLMIYLLNPTKEHRVVNGKVCVIKPGSCNSTGLCWNERVECE